MLASEDCRLIAQIKGGNLRAFEALFNKYRGQVYRTALAVTRDREAAEDVLQECFLRVHANLERLNGEKTLAPWLYRVAVNLSYNWVSRGKRQTSFLDEVIESVTASSAPSLQKQVERGELRDTIGSALDTLSFEHRVVIVLYYLNEFNLEEIAYILDCPAGTVKSRLFYAREKLRRYLLDEGILLGEMPA